jgi:hypothetical protein
MCTSHANHRGASSPRWGALYAIALVSGGLGLGADAIEAGRLAHHVLEAVVVLLTFGGMFLWVRANRGALDTAPRVTARPGGSSG